MWRTLTYVAALALAGCEDSAAPPPKQADLSKADAALLADINVAGAEFERRLNASVRANGGVVVVRDPIIGQFMFFVLSPNSSWTLSCGMGISVALGSSVSGALVEGGGNLGNDIEVQIAYSAITGADCAVLALRLGKRLRAIFREASTNAE